MTMVLPYQHNGIVSTLYSDLCSDIGPLTRVISPSPHSSSLHPSLNPLTWAVPTPSFLTKSYTGYTIMSLHPKTTQQIFDAREQLFCDLKKTLNIQQVDLPLYIPITSPYNDNLNGEPPVTFTGGADNTTYQIVHSHALLKRKHINDYRDYYQQLPVDTDQIKLLQLDPCEHVPFTCEKQQMRLKRGVLVTLKDEILSNPESYTIFGQVDSTQALTGAPSGIFSHMIAIRKCEELDVTHSLLVRQFDYCVRVQEYQDIVLEQYQKLTILRTFITRIAFDIFKMFKKFGDIKKLTLLDSFKEFPGVFIISSSQILVDKADELAKATTQAEFEAIRTSWEYELGKKYYFFAVTEIGAILDPTLPVKSSYDSRSHLYDDHSANADIFVWSEPLQRPIEISSMGYRVNSVSLFHQIKTTTTKGEDVTLYNDYEKEMVGGQFIQTIGGGIGLDRLAMLLIGATTIQDVLGYKV